MPFFCFSLNSYVDLFVLAVNCGQDEEGRFEINVEKDLVELTVQSVSKNTKEKLHRFLHRGKPESFFFSTEIFEKLRKSLCVERKTSAQNNLCFKAEKSGCNFCFNWKWPVEKQYFGKRQPWNFIKDNFLFDRIKFRYEGRGWPRKLSAKFAKLANSFTRDYVTPDDKYLLGVEIIDSCSVFSGATQGWTANPPPKNSMGRITKYL